METHCGFAQLQQALEALEGRWKLLILHQLYDHQPQRFSELERALPGISQKMLIQQLKALQRDGLVHRHDFAHVPPRVEYRLTASGASLQPVLLALRDWAADRHTDG